MTQLFPRRHGGSPDPHLRQRAEAHRVLDAARAGENIDAERIAWALRITGDAA